MACQLHLFRRSPYFCLECELDAAVERSVERLDQRFKEILDTHRRPTPEGGSTGLERTQDQLEIALREGDESSSGGRLPSSRGGSDHRGLTPLEKELVEALRPFALDADDWDGTPGIIHYHDSLELWQSRRTKVSVGNLRAARSAFAKAEGRLS